MASGRKERVMIACVTFETVKITNPIEFYDSTIVHLIHYYKKKSKEEFNVYEELYNRVCEIIWERDPTIKIVEHNEYVGNFTNMLRTVLSIIQEERAKKDTEYGCDIMVNISAGTSEYAAAASIAAMMSDATPFSVGSKGYMLSDDEDMKKAYYKDGKPVGLSYDTYDPKLLPTYSIDIPKKHLVDALRIVDQRNERKESTSSSVLSDILREEGIWYRDETNTKNKV